MGNKESVAVIQTDEEKQREVIRGWKRDIRKSQRELDKQMNSYKLSEQKAKKEIQACVKRGDQASARTLARNVVQVRKAYDRSYSAKAQLDVLTSNIDQQARMLRTTKIIQQSSEIQAAMNAACSVPEVASVMQEMSKQMMTAGLIEEEVDAAFDDLDGDMDDLADDEVDKVVAEMVAGQLDQQRVQRGQIAQPQQQGTMQPVVDDIEARLAALDQD
ncbi:putative Charged multivesicular body protein 3 [Blattamonas nauphoetae]|uniref:Charged multivesicular body protein 3 n=1 Tax=Blattamonas nauphoetae TaxID=2049346 RepID=A0ABQ9YFG4_9EUKA|nr:putative Charged multivesicular body protein 3 [Blattamonas nauphoetae]